MRERRRTRVLLRCLTCVLVVVGIPAQSVRGRIGGKLDDPTLVERFRIGVYLQREGADRVWAAVDSDGAFAFDGLPAGDYAYELHTGNDSSCQGVARRLRPPALGTGYHAGGQVHLAPGATVTITVKTPRVIELRGRVVANARPVAGVHVFLPRQEGMQSGPRHFGFDQPEPDEPRADNMQPCCVTDNEGNFSFAVLRPGQWNLYLRPPDATLSVGPFAVGRYGAEGSPRYTLELPTARLRGRFRTPDHWRDRGPFTAYLFRRSLAEADPFAMHDLMLSQVMRMREQELAAGGTFEVPWLPAGDYVLRIVGRRDGERFIAVQRCVTTDGHGVVDLGDLGLGVTVDATVAWGPPGPPTAHGAAVCVQALPVDDRGPAFLRSALIENGRLDLAGIEPGRYRLQRFLPQFFVGTWGLLGPTVGQPVTVVVGADGKVVPPYVD